MRRILVLSHTPNDNNNLELLLVGSLLHRLLTLSCCIVLKYLSSSGTWDTSWIFLKSLPMAFPASLSRMLLESAEGEHCLLPGGHSLMFSLWQKPTINHQLNTTNISAQNNNSK
jgi:hypothetical protein